MPEIERHETIGFARHANLCVTVAGPHHHSDDEWEHFMTHLRAYPDPTQTRILVSTLGASPSRQQRARLKQVMSEVSGGGLHIAVMADAVLPRMATRAMAFFFKRTRFFALDDVEGALAFLGVDDVSPQQAREMIRDMRRQLGFA